METLLLDARAPGAIERAVALLAAGELVALPTETVYGLAADAARPEALAAVFQAKERPLFDPLIVHLPDQSWLKQLTAPSPPQAALVERLAAFWPGPLTVVLPRRPDHVPDLVTAGGELVAVRRSAHPVFAAVVERFGRPLAAPSANRFGRISPTTGTHVVSELAGRIPLVLDAGPTEHGLESTVVLVADEGVNILRHGPITAEVLEFYSIPVLGQGDNALEARKSAPGQTPGHYAPRTPLLLVPSSPGPLDHPPEKIGWLGFRADRPWRDAWQTGPVEYLSRAGNLRDAATRLFATLRRLDEAGLALIVAEAVPEEGLGRAIMDRLRRAAAGSGQI